MKQPWRKFRTLSWQERSLLAGAIILLPLSAISLRLFGFKRTLAFFAHLLPVGAAEQTPLRARQTARLVQVAATQVFPGATCLHRSLTLWSLLRPQGMEARLIFGAHKPANRFEAHAWIEYDGLVLNDTPDVGQRFVVFADEAVA